LSEEIALLLKISHLNDKVLKSMQVALSPDNLVLPAGLTIEMSVHNKSLNIIIRDTSGKIERVKQTVNDILRCMCAVYRSLKNVSQI